MAEEKSRAKHLEIFFHLLAWGVIFVFPHMLMGHSGGVISTEKFLRMLGAPLSLAFVFYVNYLWLVPRLYMQKRHKEFVLWNIVLYIGGALVMHFWMQVIQYFYVGEMHMPGPGEIFDPGRNHPEGPPAGPEMLFMRVRDVMLYFFITILAIMIEMSRRWSKAEEARQQAELKQKEAELKNLKQQISPHFLLNTLNNIQALITLDPDKAQTCVQDLGKLLRHMLYENQNAYTQLGKEVEFLSKYIDLMRIRISDEVDLQYEVCIDGAEHLPIVPLLAISLIENAFKHGISSTQPSFIHIRIEANPETRQACCEIVNSNYPKKTSDRSGHGVGLEQVQKRLDANYVGRYQWDKGVDEEGKIYHSKLTITL